jgi:hypothetical protein
MITGTLARVHAGPTAMATAESICRQVVSLAGLSTANLNYFTLEGAAMPLAFVRADGVDVPLRRFPFQRSRTLRERAGEGPWVEAWVRRPWHPYDRLFGELGVTAVAVAPIRVGAPDRPDRDLVVDAGTRRSPSPARLLEFAGFAGA